ncbi:glycosyltransferase family 4 protein [Phragmitibacter flavus]|nr:glycosyltransferase family 4 protein [Phragmitibacter flavus]
MNGKTNAVAADTPIRVFFCCTGLGAVNRGFETFFREAFDELKTDPKIEALLIKGAKQDHTGSQRTPDEHAIRFFSRTGKIATAIGRLTGRSAYAVEQWSSFPAVVRQIRKFHPAVVFYSEANLGFLLHRFRRQIGVPYRLLFSNGGPCHPPFTQYDFVHQVAPVYHQEAIHFGEPPAKHFLVPYGIKVPSSPFPDADAKRRLRSTLNLPLNRPIVLSVGWISKHHKRMDFVIEEIARMSGPRPFLQLLGSTDSQSNEIITLANERLGSDNYSVLSLPKESVHDYYQASDAFVLASLSEGFGRVYIESLMHGLPTIAHRNEVTEYVLSDVGTLIDLTKPGQLAAQLSEELGKTPVSSFEEMSRRRNSIVRRFSWDALRTSYIDMFRSVASTFTHS